MTGTTTVVKLLKKKHIGKLYNLFVSCYMSSDAPNLFKKRKNTPSLPPKENLPE